MRKSRITAVFLALVGAAAAAGPAQAQFNLIQLGGPTTGRVGYHMSVAGISVYPNDLPRGNSGGAFSGSCQLAWWNVTYEGQLPPGVQFQSGLPLFSGTPRQPGRWAGTMTFDLRCTGGPDTGLYRRSIPVTFAIEP